MPKVLRQMVIKQDLGEAGPILDTVSAEFLWLSHLHGGTEEIGSLGLPSTPLKSPGRGQVFKMIAPLWLLHKAGQHHLQLGAALLHSHQGGRGGEEEPHGIPISTSIKDTL